MLSSRLLGNLAQMLGYDVKVSEVHGMAQRGGSVVTYIRFGEQVCSPLVEVGEADYIIAFEKLEALRWLPYLKKGGKMIVSAQEILPMPVITGAAKYPDNSQDTLEAAGALLVDAFTIAKECGNEKAVNIVMMGILAKQLTYPKEQWVESIHQTVPQKVLDINLKAFDRGYGLV